VSLSTQLRFDPVDPSATMSGVPPIEVAPTDVDVWAYALGASAAHVEAWLTLLSREERERADRFVRTSDRSDYIVAHGVLRALLSRYCGLPPDELAFGRIANDKPMLTNPEAVDRGVSFNLAHSHGRALLAVGGQRVVGVDLEQERDDFDPLTLARHFFFGSELAAILAAPTHRQCDAFFRHWVAKESVLKAQGIGLSFPLDAFGVEFDEDGRLASVRSLDSTRLSSEWRVRMLALESGWHGAVSARGEGWKVRFSQRQDQSI
jgi:4'-phosphopantetheinyl transferase